MLPRSIQIIPAYGRKYNNITAMMNDWENGKDFKIVNGPYCSVRDEEVLKKEYDSITICFIDESGVKAMCYNLWEHPLRGITVYI